MHEVALKDAMLITVQPRDHNGLVVACSGILTGEELIRLKRSLASEQNGGLRYLVVDLTQVDDVTISTVELEVSVEQDERLAAIATPRMLVAVVAPKDIIFGLSRMWEVFVERKTGWVTHVFRSMTHAESWIQQNLEPIS